MSKTIYKPSISEPKWQKYWEEQGLFQGTERQERSGTKQPKSYLLYAFAYPSGSGLHVGHVEPKTALDILARYKRMTGEQVFFPVGWDAFGLPAENYAIKTGIHPAETTKNAIDTFRRQIKRLGISYDWQNEIATNHPAYYKWTQWIFLQLHKKGLAYQKMGMVNWCTSCQTVLANEQVVNGECERCGSQVIQKEMKQWYFKITEYKDELIDGLDMVDWPEATKQQQLNWIGRGRGLSIYFTLKSDNSKMPIWTKFWETTFGTTFLVIAPEKFEELGLFSQVDSIHKKSVEAYLDQSKKKTEEERKIAKEKTGVDTGMKVINPVNGEEVPLFIADYVLMGVGTAIVMGVPAHDERDFQFAKKFNLPIKQVVAYDDESINEKVKSAEMSYEGEGRLVNSDQFDGQDAWGIGKENMANWMIKQGFAEWKTTYKLRDWLISRQRYWGAPIPMVYDPEGNAHPVKEEHLPWELPTDVEFKPTGESPLTYSKEFIDRTERLYGKGWRPEFDTMDTFVDSSWYFLRYVDSRNPEQFASKEQLRNWLPVDFYMIGPEHIVLHLLYSRFFTKFLRDEGYLRDDSGQIPDLSKKEEELKIEDRISSTQDGERRTEGSIGNESRDSLTTHDYRLKTTNWRVDEPFMKMRHQGMILGPDGRKMSKSKGNVINPDEIIEKFGADTLRVYEMFMGPIEADKPWNTNSVVGVYRFLNRIFTLINRFQIHPKGALPSESKGQTTNHRLQNTAIRRKLHQTIKKVTEDIPELKFNTAIAAMMELVNLWEAEIKEQSNTARNLQPLDVDEVQAFIKILCPFAPFIAEELWSLVNRKIEEQGNSSNHKTLNTKQTSVHLQPWPEFNPELLFEDQVTIVIQINGKVRGQLKLTVDQAKDEQTVVELANQETTIQKWLTDKQISKVIYIPLKILNLVVR